MSIESHFMVAVGGLVVICCDDQNKRWEHAYRKVCLSTAADFSVSGDTLSNSDGKAYSNPPKRILLLGSGGVEGGKITSTVRSGDVSHYPKLEKYYEVIH